MMDLEARIRELEELLHGYLLYGQYPQGGGLVDRITVLEQRVEELEKGLEAITDGSESTTDAGTG